MDITKLRIFFFVLLLTSCGRSPFTNKDAPVNGAVFGQQQVSSGLLLRNSGYQLFPYWRVGPSIGDESRLLLVVTDHQHRPVNPTFELRAMLWMPSMGHGSFPVAISNIGVGLFELRDVFFTMDGFWNLHFQLYNNDQLVEEVLWGLTF